MQNQMMKKSLFPILTLFALLLTGCSTNYAFRPTVPEAMRTIAVPTFRNESNQMQIGPIVTRQILREFEREGTFSIHQLGTAAVEVQGEVVSVAYNASSYNRRSGLIGSGGYLLLTAKVSVIDKRQGRVMIDNRLYTAEAPMSATHDHQTAQRDAAGRVADMLARQVVDDVLNLKW